MAELLAGKYKFILGKLPHRKFHALLKKLKRKEKRREAAIVRENFEIERIKGLEKLPNFFQNLAEQEREHRLKLDFEEFDSKKKHEAWLRREQAAQIEFRRKQEIENQIKINRQEQEKKIREEWEEQQKKEKEEIEEKEMKAKEKERLLHEATSSLAKDGEEPWHNPIVGINGSNTRNVDGIDGARKENCPFFVKTGACRFGNRCSRFHDKPASSRTLMISSMYSHFSIDQSIRDEFDSDMSLEYDDCDTYQHFLDFYRDVLPEFESIGRVLQFKVCCNHEPHLRGNVYVQYESESDTIKAYGIFNCRWYGGKQLSCQFSNVTRWKSAICGLFGRNRCPKGKHCNFLHVFRNPDEFPGDFNDDDSSLHRSSRHRHSFLSSSQRRRSRRSISPIDEWKSKDHLSRSTSSLRHSERKCYDSPVSHRAKNRRREESDDESPRRTNKRKEKRREEYDDDDDLPRRTTKRKGKRRSLSDDDDSPRRTTKRKEKRHVSDDDDSPRRTTKRKENRHDVSDDDDSPRRTTKRKEKRRKKSKKKHRSK